MVFMVTGSARIFWNHIFKKFSYCWFVESDRSSFNIADTFGELKALCQKDNVMMFQCRSCISKESAFENYSGRHMISWLVAMFSLYDLTGFV